jgi:HSP20 family protein
MSLKLYNPFYSVRHVDNTLYSKYGFYKPATDLYESDDEFTIEMNLPGFNRDQISIDATFDTLEVKTQLKESDETVEQETIWTAKHLERVNRKYYRKIKFNKPLDINKATTSYVNGVLKITIPKAPEAKRISLTID